MDAKLKRIYYGLQGYWRGASAIEKLATAAKVSEDVAKNWLKKQTIWQVYLPAPKYIPRPSFTVDTPNEVHQADLLFLPHDRVKRKTYKYALTVVDIASRYKDAEPLTSKDSTEVASALGKIYKRMKWPKLLQVDVGTEFMGAVTKTLRDQILKSEEPRQSTIGVKALLKDSIAPWPSACLGIIIGKSWTATGIGNGCKDYQMSSPRSTTK